MNDPSIEFHEVYPQFTLVSKNKLRQWLLQISKMEKCELSGLNYIFLTDDALLEMNQQHLGHDHYTDIITFPLHSEGDPIEADIYISIDRVKENAKEFSARFEKELLRVIAHGLLHLCGYSDKTGPEQAEMRKKEEEHIDLYGEIK